jgi:adenine-specific DNA-methyltransferase
MLLARIQTQGELLGTVCNVNQGLRTGADKVTNKHFESCKLDPRSYARGEGIFILRRAELARLRLTPFEQKRILPLFKNSDIHKYVCETRTQYSLIDLSWPGDRELDLSLVPNLIGHLSKYRTILEGRKENANGLDKAIAKGIWWPMSVRRKLDFSQEKVVAPQRSRTNVFGYNDGPWYTSADVYFITRKDLAYNLKYVLALLNSKLYFVWLYHKGKRKGEMLELYQKPLSEIPIKRIPQPDQERFIALVDGILQATSQSTTADTSGLEREIDELVYDLYGLTRAERTLVQETAR